jgi:hypothetical protein
MNTNWNDDLQEFQIGAHKLSLFSGEHVTFCNIDAFFLSVIGNDRDQVVDVTDFSRRRKLLGKFICQLVSGS